VEASSPSIVLNEVSNSTLYYVCIAYLATSIPESRQALSLVALTLIPVYCEVSNKSTNERQCTLTLNRPFERQEFILATR